MTPDDPNALQYPTQEYTTNAKPQNIDVPDPRITALAEVMTVENIVWRLDEGNLALDSQATAASLIDKLPPDWCGHGDYQANLMAHMETATALAEAQAEIARLRAGYRAILDDELFRENPGAFGMAAATRMQAIARAALEESDHARCIWHTSVIPALEER
jgi:hypothetical protein